MSKTTILVLTMLAAACGKDEGKPAAEPPVTEDEAPETAPPGEPMPPKEKPATTASSNDVDLTFSGAFNATLKGKAGLCSVRKSGPMPGATWQVRSEELGVKPDFNLSIISETKSFDDPAMVVNVTGDNRTSYARKRGSKDVKLVVAHDGTSAELDVLLEHVASSAGDLHVVGTIKCPTPKVFE